MKFYPYPCVRTLTTSNAKMRTWVILWHKQPVKDKLHDQFPRNAYRPRHKVLWHIIYMNQDCVVPRHLVVIVDDSKRPGDIDNQSWNIIAADNTIVRLLVSVA
jgi:hypothetical protein